jgi:hypothetical protein
VACPGFTAQTRERTAFFGLTRLQCDCGRVHTWRPVDSAARAPYNTG